MTVSHKAGDAFNDAEFNRLIENAFPPKRRRSEPMDFKPTIPVCSGESCRQGRAECETPEACRLPDAYHATSEGIVRGVLWGTAIIFCTALALLPWLLEYLAP